MTRLAPLIRSQITSVADRRLLQDIGHRMVFWQASPGGYTIRTDIGRGYAIRTDIGSVHKRGMPAMHDGRLCYRPFAIIRSVSDSDYPKYYTT